MKYKISPNDSINETLKKMNEYDELYLNEGVYNEKVEFFNNNIKIKGAGKDKTIITNHDFYHKIMPDFNECNTFRTYTVFVGGDNVSVEDVTIMNSCSDSLKYGQAVALHVEGNNFVITNSIIKSAQDTLFTGPLPKDLIQRHQGFLPQSHLKGNKSIQIYDKCEIIGNVDFIFGGAYALFINCDIVSINLDGHDGGYLTAPSHEESDKFGYLFYKCNLIAKGDAKNIYLGRPWRDYGTCAFIMCNLGKHINPLGWNKWNNTNRDKTARFYEYSENVDLSKREKWAHTLNKAEALAYVEKFFKFINYNN
ncbi:MAG: hypothetical protein K6E20_03280 [Acholeplasmatales bacterium]|nr:hypothetical protein [Acholeplasmatales bacterium]